MWQHAFSKLPDIMQTPIHGNSTQTCIDALFSYEEVHKICPNCKTSGHYNILINDSVNKRFILVDDTNVDYNAKLDIVKEVCYIVAYTKI